MTITFNVNCSLAPGDPLIIVLAEVVAALDGIKAQLAADSTAKTDLAAAIAALDDLKARFDRIDPMIKTKTIS